MDRSLGHMWPRATSKLYEEPKKLVVVEGRHFEAYQGPKHDQFATPAVEWFKTYLMAR